MNKTELDKTLEDELVKIRQEKGFIRFVFNYCETQEERKRLLTFIQSGHNQRKEVLLMASQIAIEAGTSEGELVEE